MRLFIAIPLPPDIKRSVAAAQTALIHAGAKGRFVPQDNFHITVHFIGESNSLADLADAMHESVRDTRPFLLRLAEYGGFASGSGKTAFLSLTGDLPELNALYESLESALWERGFSRNRSRLSPHITLGRNVTGDQDFILPPQNAAFQVQTLVLYESRNVNGVMQYTPLHRESIR